MIAHQLVLSALLLGSLVIALPSGSVVQTSCTEVNHRRSSLDHPGLIGRDYSSSGIYIPDTARERPQEGVLIAQGRGPNKSSRRYRRSPVKIAPLHDRVIVKPSRQETSKGGLIIPDTAAEKPQHGEVIAIGRGKVPSSPVTPLDVKIGDRVLFSKYQGKH